MSYQVIAPPPSLKKYVNYFWALDAEIDAAVPKTFTVMSSGEPGLIFQQCAGVFTGFEKEPLPQLFVFGQATQYGQLECSGSFRSIGISLQPTALKSLFGLDAKELTDENICISNLSKTSLSEQLLECNSAQQQASCIFNFLQAQIKQHDTENKKLQYAVTALQQGKKLPFVLHELNLSERSLERLFLTHIGITPILYARICRFQSSLTLMRQGRARSLTDVAYSLGYFDQAHFIRDFKKFAGVSPGIYLRKAIERMPGFPEW